MRLRNGGGFFAVMFVAFVLTIGVVFLTHCGGTNAPSPHDAGFAQSTTTSTPFESGEPREDAGFIGVIHDGGPVELMDAGGGGAVDAGGGLFDVDAGGGEPFRFDAGF